MTPTTRKCSAAVLSLIALAALVSCDVSFENPPSMPEEKNVDAKPYLGHWTQIKPDGEKDGPPARLRVFRDEKGELNWRLSNKEGQELKHKVKLTMISKRIFAVVAAENESESDWFILRVKMNETKDRLTLFFAKRADVKSHLQNGVVAGKIRKQGTDNESVHVTAGPKKLRAYIADHEGVFSSKAITLRRDED